MSAFRFKCTNCGNEEFTIPFLATVPFRSLLDSFDYKGFGYFLYSLRIPPESRIICVKCNQSSLISVHESK